MPSNEASNEEEIKGLIKKISENLGKVEGNPHLVNIVRNLIYYLEDPSHHVLKASRLKRCSYHHGEPRKCEYNGFDKVRKCPYTGDEQECLFEQLKEEAMGYFSGSYSH